MRSWQATLRPVSAAWTSSGKFWAITSLHAVKEVWRVGWETLATSKVRGFESGSGLAGGGDFGAIVEGEWKK